MAHGSILQASTVFATTPAERSDEYWNIRGPSHVGIGLNGDTVRLTISDLDLDARNPIGSNSHYIEAPRVAVGVAGWLGDAHEKAVYEEVSVSGARHISSNALNHARNTVAVLPPLHYPQTTVSSVGVLGASHVEAAWWRTNRRPEVRIGTGWQSLRGAAHDGEAPQLPCPEGSYHDAVTVSRKAGKGIEDTGTAQSD